MMRQRLQDASLGAYRCFVNRGSPAGAGQVRSKWQVPEDPLTGPMERCVERKTTKGGLVRREPGPIDAPFHLYGFCTAAIRGIDPLAVIVMSAFANGATSRRSARVNPIVLVSDKRGARLDGKQS